jgi:predicted DsbA family dithiol-disulfide isomerase
VDRLARDFELDLDWRPYELHPEIPLEGLTPESLFGSRRRGDDYMGMLRTEGESEGIVIKPPPRIANSLASLQAAELARDRGGDVFNRLHWRLFEAYFTGGRDIGDPEVLAGLAAESGLDRAELCGALDDGRYRERIRASVDAAAGAGITGTPTFIFDNRFALVGAQSYDVFSSITSRILDRRAAGYPEN